MTNFDRFHREAMGVRGLLSISRLPVYFFDERPPCAPFSSRQAEWTPLQASCSSCSGFGNFGTWFRKPNFNYSGLKSYKYNKSGRFSADHLIASNRRQGVIGRNIAFCGRGKLFSLVTLYESLWDTFEIIFACYIFFRSKVWSNILAHIALKCASEKVS